MNPLSHFTLAKETEELDAIIKRTGTSPPPFYAGLTNNASMMTAWTSNDNESPPSYIRLRQQTAESGVIDFYLDAAHDPEPFFRNVFQAAQDWQLNTLIGYTQSGLGETFLDRFGFSPAGPLRSLRANNPISLTDSEPGENYIVQRFSTFNHVPTLSALLNRAYRDRFGRPENEHKAVTAETIKSKIQGPGRESASKRIWLALDIFGKGVGVLQSFGNGQIDAPGIVPEERENNLHRILLNRVIQADEDPNPLHMLSFDDPPSWIADYENAGFVINETWAGFSRKL